MPHTVAKYSSNLFGNTVLFQRGNYVNGGKDSLEALPRTGLSEAPGHMLVDEAPDAEAATPEGHPCHHDAKKQCHVLPSGKLHAPENGAIQNPGRAPDPLSILP